MFARCVTMQGRPETMDQAQKIFAESVIPAARQQPGFENAWFLMDPVTGKGMSITMWATEADMQAGERNGFLQAQIAKFGPLLVGPPTRELYVVAAQS